MRRVALAIVTTVSALVLLFSYHTSTMGIGTSSAGTTPTAAAPRATQAPQDTTSGGTSGGSGSGGGDGTYTGETVQTRWGPVQVQITVAGGKITDSTAVVYPHDNFRDQEINNVALPILAQEVLDAQGAGIDHVSGATVTSDGYVASLQSALDQANL